MKASRFVFLSILLCGLFALGGPALGLTQETPAASQETAPEVPDTVETGDLVEILFTVSLEDGGLIRTNRETLYTDPDQPRAPFFDDLPLQDAFGPEAMVAGDGTGIPGAPGLDEAVLGMKVRETRTVRLSPDKAYGERNEKGVQQYDAVKKVPREAVLSAQSYVQRFGSFPSVGKEVNLNPYFPFRVVEVTEDHVRLEALAEDGKRIEQEYGTTEIRVGEKEITLTIEPVMGAPFLLNGQKGRIVMSDGETFSVDFNHPLLGQPVEVEVEVVSLQKASVFDAMILPWTEDHDRALERAQKEKKPLVLVLYSPTCGWSRKLLTGTLEDPRIKRLRDAFVWAKIDSSAQKDLYSFYEQDGYPLLLLLDAEGEVLQRIDGYRPAGALKASLDQVLQGPEKKDDMARAQ